jgi:hypothetical protein
MIVPGGGMKETVAREAKAITTADTTIVDPRNRMAIAEKFLPAKKGVVSGMVDALVTVVLTETTAVLSLIGEHAVGAAVRHPGVGLVDEVLRRPPPHKVVAGAVADALDGDEVAVVATIKAPPLRDCGSSKRSLPRISWM